MGQNENATDPTKTELIIEYFANPLDTRSIKEFAEDNGMSPSTVKRYERAHQMAIAKRFEVNRDAYLKDLRAKAYKSISNRIGRSDKACEIVLKMGGDLVDKSEITYTAKSPEEKRARVKALLEKVSAKLDKEVGSDGVGPSTAHG